MGIKKLPIAITMAITAGTALANLSWAAAADQPRHSPYVGQQQRAVKTLSAQEAADLEAGRGMGLSKVAELNHYPGPKHVLELADSLKLTAAQIRQVTQQQAAMEQDAQRLGKQVLAKEAALEALFAAGRVDAAPVRALIADIGQLHGELRFVHVNAHLATTGVLAPAQIAAYDQLRGYTAAAAVDHSHRH